MHMAYVSVYTSICIYRDTYIYIYTSYTHYIHIIHRYMYMYIAKLANIN